MKCERCNAELVEGHVFCDNCGAEVQFVPDFNVFEEEVLPSIVSQDPVDKNRYKDFREKTAVEHKSRSGKFIYAGILLVLVLLCVGIYSYMQSYAREFKQGLRADEKGDYVEAIRHYSTALNRNMTVEAYLKMGDDYLRMENYEEAESCYNKAIEMAKDNPSDLAEAYSALLSLYRITDDYDAIDELYQGITDKEVKKTLNKIFIKPPKFSEESGEYDDDIELSFKTKKGLDVYYTLDNTMPSSHNGILYEERVLIESGQTTVTACCVDENGTWGLPAQRTYTVSYKPPQMPVASPSSGSFQYQVFVTLTSEDDGDIYYAWSETIPTRNSRKYTGPIPVPEGNNVLSAVVIDSHGLTSVVLRCNYVFMP